MPCPCPLIPNYLAENVRPYYAPLSGAIPRHPCGNFNGMGYDPVGSRLSYYRGGDLSQPFPVSLNKPSSRPPPPPLPFPQTAPQRVCWVWQTRPLGRGQVGIVLSHPHVTNRFEKSLGSPQDSAAR